MMVICLGNSSHDLALRLGSLTVGEIKPQNHGNKRHKENEHVERIEQRR